jgi:UDP-N-acetylglucosamine kinase
VTDPGSGRYTLPERQNERIFLDSIVPQLLAQAVPQDHPVLVIVGAQPGAGKTGVTGNILDLLAQRGGAAHIDMDRYNPYHPSHNWIRYSDPARADAHLRPDGELWWQRAQSYAITRRLDVLLESAMQAEAEFEDIASRFAAAEYRVEVALMAVPRALSRLGILARYLEEVTDTGRGRLVAPEIHDRCYDGVLRGARAVDTGQAPAQEISVFRRGNSLVYSNSRDSLGRWARPPGAATAVTTERQRQLTDPELKAYRTLRDRLAHEFGEQELGLPELE